MLYLEPSFYPLKGLSGLLMTAKGREAHIALATGTEAYPWRADHIGTIE